MATVVYAICTLASLTCAGLLLRGWLRTRAALLGYTGVGFVGIAANNVLLLFDESMLASQDLSTWRALPALLGTMVLIFGLIWEVRR